MGRRRAAFSLSQARLSVWLSVGVRTTPFPSSRPRFAPDLPSVPPDEAQASPRRSFTPLVVAQLALVHPAVRLEGRIALPRDASSRVWGTRGTTYPEASGEPACLQSFRPLMSCRARTRRDSELDRSTVVLSGPCPHTHSGTPKTTNGTPGKNENGTPALERTSRVRFHLNRHNGI